MTYPNFLAGLMSLRGAGMTPGPMAPGPGSPPMFAQNAPAVAFNPTTQGLRPGAPPPGLANMGGPFERFYGALLGNIPLPLANWNFMNLPEPAQQPVSNNIMDVIQRLQNRAGGGGGIGPNRPSGDRGRSRDAGSATGGGHDQPGRGPDDHGP